MLTDERCHGDAALCTLSSQFLALLNDEPEHGMYLYEYS
jgi:hypothetical protein